MDSCSLEKITAGTLVGASVAVEVVGVISGETMSGHLDAMATRGSKVRAVPTTITMIKIARITMILPFLIRVNLIDRAVGFGEGVVGHMVYPVT